MVGDFFGRLLGRSPRKERGDTPVPGAGPTPVQQAAQEQPEAAEPPGAAGIQARRLALGIMSRHVAPKRPWHSCLSAGAKPRWATRIGAPRARLRTAAQGFLRRAPLGLFHWRAYSAPYVPEEFSPVWRVPPSRGDLPQDLTGQTMAPSAPRGSTAARRLAAPLRHPGSPAPPPSSTWRGAHGSLAMGARSKAPMVRLPSTSIKRRKPGVALHRPTIHVDRPMLTNIHSPIVSGPLGPMVTPEKWAAREYEHARSKPEKQPTSVVEFMFGPEDAQSIGLGQSLRPKESSGPWEPPPVPARPSAPRPVPSAGLAGAEVPGPGPRAGQRPGPQPGREGDTAPRTPSGGGPVQRARRMVMRGVALVFRKPVPSSGVPLRPELPVASVPRDMPWQATYAGSADTYRGRPQRQEAVEEVGMTRRPRSLAMAVDMVFARRKAPASAQQEGESVAGTAPPVRREGRPARRQQPAQPAGRGSKGNVSRVGQVPGVEGHQLGPARETDERPAPSAGPERPLRARVPEEAAPGTRTSGVPAGLVRRSIHVASLAREMVLRKPSRLATSPLERGTVQPAPSQADATRHTAGRSARPDGHLPSQSTARPQVVGESHGAHTKDAAPDVPLPAPGQAALPRSQAATGGQVEAAPSLNVRDASSDDRRGLRVVTSQVPGRPHGLFLRARELVFRKSAPASPGAATPSLSHSQQLAPASAARAGHGPASGGASQGYDRSDGRQASRLPRVTRAARAVVRRSVGVVVRSGETAFRKRTEDAHESPVSLLGTGLMKGGTSPAGQSGPQGTRAIEVEGWQGGAPRTAKLWERPVLTPMARLQRAARRSTATVLHARQMVFRKWTPSGVQARRMDGPDVAAASLERGASGEVSPLVPARGSPAAPLDQSGLRAADEVRPPSRQRRLSAPLMRSLSSAGHGPPPAVRRSQAAVPARGERRAGLTQIGLVWLERAGGKAQGGTSDSLPLATASYRAPLDARGQARLPEMAPPAARDVRNGASSNGKVQRKVETRSVPASKNGATPVQGSEHTEVLRRLAVPSVQRAEVEQTPVSTEDGSQQSAPELKPEQVELLASRIYSYIKQKLAMERERHGRPGFPLWP